MNPTTMNPLFTALYPSHSHGDLWPGSEPYAEWRPPCSGRLALEYATRFGLHVLPLLGEGSEPVRAAVPGGARDASRDPATIHAWWTRAPHANVAIACKKSGLLVLEVDRDEGGPETLAMHAERLGALLPTWTARGPRGATQFFFSHADPELSDLPLLRPLGPGVRVVHQGYVVAAPSLLRGQRCAWHFDRRPGRIALAALPAAWLDRLAGRHLPANGLSGLDARHSFLGRAFEAAGWLGRRLDDGRRIARCPWAHEHAWPSAAAGDMATVLLSPEPNPCCGKFACGHPECARRKAHDLLAALPPEATEAARAALPGAAELERYVSFAANDVGAALAGAAGVEGEAGAARSTEGA